MHLYDFLRRYCLYGDISNIISYLSFSELPTTQPWITVNHWVLGFSKDPFTYMVLQGLLWKQTSDQILSQHLQVTSSVQPPQLIHPFIHQIFVGHLLHIRWPSRHWNTNDGQGGWQSPFRTDLWPCLPLSSPCQSATLPPSLPIVPRLFLLLGTLHLVKSYWLFL